MGGLGGIETQPDAGTNLMAASELPAAAFPTTAIHTGSFMPCKLCGFLPFLPRFPSHSAQRAHKDADNARPHSGTLKEALQAIERVTFTLLPPGVLYKNATTNVTLPVRPVTQPHLSFLLPNPPLPSRTSPIGLVVRPLA